MTKTKHDLTMRATAVRVGFAPFNFSDFKKHFPYYRFNTKTHQTNWSFTVHGINGEVVLRGGGLNKEPNQKYINKLAKILSSAVLHKAVKKKK